MTTQTVVGPARSWFHWPDRLDNLFEDRSLIRLEEVVHDGFLVIRAELPGVDPEKDVELIVKNGILSLCADRREESETKGEKQRLTEFRYGHFERTIVLPAGTTEQDVKATYENGILEVRVPIDGERAEARRVPITRT